MGAFARAVLSGTAFLFVAACADTGARRWLADQAGPAGFTGIQAADASGTPLLLLRTGSPGGVLNVYIEGDGAGWPSRGRPPPDPSPDTATVLAMAAADPGATVAYIGRPCQFLDATGLSACDPRLWTRDRFSDHAVALIDAAVSRARALTQAATVRLVGYSGGGVIATLLAARRRDVTALVTVAAPVQVGAWVRHHGLSALNGQDPDTLERLQVSATHLAGSDDKIVSPALIEAFARRTDARFVVIPGYDHQCCWGRDWGKLIRNGTLQPWNRAPE